MPISNNSARETLLTAESPIEGARQSALHGVVGAHRFLLDPAHRPAVECALRIRAVENSLFELFGRGKLHGTIHTCIGQEFSGALLTRHLRDGDFVTSNHRCHGHFIGATQNWKGLIDELVGNLDGVCAGIGSSQHLWAPNFISNGQQGGLLPVAAGIALDRKLKGGSNVVISFLGEGTLGEGVVYETFNLDALWELPHILICENNFYSQSTPQQSGVAGRIVDRARGFGIASEVANTWDPSSYDAALERALLRARTENKPSFIVLQTYRLNPHSKGDDTRDRTEVEWFRDHDPATLAVRHYQEFADLYGRYVQDAIEAIEVALEKEPLDPQQYFGDQLPRYDPSLNVIWTPVPAKVKSDLRIAQQLNVFYKDWFTTDETAVFLGEDLADPYGGAFKIAKEMTNFFGPRVRTTPISEAAITGMGVGLAITGRRSFVEIMFGDFITYAFDQIINNASKMFHMYNRHISCPVIIRTPMGGRRGYGPTHSQSLERFLIGIDNCCTLGLTSITTVALQLAGLEELRCPVILLENKADYTARSFTPPAGFYVSEDRALFPTILIQATHAISDVTLLVYGGIARFVADNLLELFEKTDTIPEVVVPVLLSPVNLGPILESVRRTRKLVIVEEAAGYGSLGAEIVAQVLEIADFAFSVRRVYGKSAPIPSAPSLEAAALPSIQDVCAAVDSIMGANA